jgi:hypothetical protein
MKKQMIREKEGRAEIVRKISDNSSERRVREDSEQIKGEPDVAE